MIVDTHTHAADARDERYPLQPTGVGGPAWFNESGDVESLLEAMDGAGVDQAVLVQAIAAYGYDNAYARDAAARAPERLSFVGAVDMTGPDPAADIEALVKLGGVRGVRLFGVGTIEPSWLTDGRALAVWAAAADLGTALVPCLWGRDLPELCPLVEAHPGVSVAVDHCGFPDLAGGPPFPNAGTLFALADLPSIYLKVSTHVLLDVADPADLLDVLAERFGPDRLCWGSNYPHTDAMGYADNVDFARRAARRLDDPGRAAFLHGTARRLWFDAPT